MVRVGAVVAVHQTAEIGHEQTFSLSSCHMQKIRWNFF
jgi:hypothetical protein